MSKLAPFEGIGAIEIRLVYRPLRPYQIIRCIVADAKELIFLTTHFAFPQLTLRKGYVIYGRTALNTKSSFGYILPYCKYA
jgi:hypothetical protein